MRRAIFLAVLVAAAPAFAAKRPLNYRKRRAPAVPQATGEAPGAARKLAGGWDPKVREALELLIETHGDKSPGYDADNPPVAVVPFTEGLIDGDFAELVFWKLTRQAEFKVDDDFWNIVPLAYGRQRIRAAYEEFHEKPQASWPSQPELHAFRKGLLKSYRDVCAKVGRKECRVYLARLFRGYTIDDARKYAELVWDEEVGAEERLDPVPGYPGDPEPLVVQRGLRPVLEMVDLVRRLREAGFDVWTTALVAQQALEAAGPKLGIDVTRVRGIRQTQFKERLTGRPLEPIPAGGGRVEAIVTATGHTPALVIGANPDDQALLEYGNGLRILLDHGFRDAKDEKLRQMAGERGWLVQSPFTKR